jgi:hypothetical protein
MLNAEFCDRRSLPPSANILFHGFRIPNAPGQQAFQHETEFTRSD